MQKHGEESQNTPGTESGEVYIKSNKDFQKYINGKGKTRESESTLLNRARAMMTEHGKSRSTECSIQFLLVKLAFRNPGDKYKYSIEHIRTVQERLIEEEGEEDQVRKYVSVKHKPIGPAGMHP